MCKCQNVILNVRKEVSSAVEKFHWKKLELAHSVKVAILFPAFFVAALYFVQEGPIQT